MSDNNTVIDLFCGCGGLSLGFEMAGYDVKLAIDNWGDALNTYARNHKTTKTLCSDLMKLRPEEVEEKFNLHSVSVIIGGPPCQGFSIAGKRIIEDDRNKLYKSFVRFVEYFKPKAFVMENVPNILSIGNGAIKDAIFKDFENLGYDVECKVLTASSYGVPQNRRRAIFVGLKNVKFEFPDKAAKHIVTSSEAISDLPEYSLKDGAPYPSEPLSTYQALVRKDSKGVYNHQITEHSQRTKDIISLVPDGGNYKDLPLALQSTRKVHIAWTRLNSQKPSFTIDTGHRHHFHYKYNRIPTVRESARIQSFPDRFVFTGSRTSQNKQVGNAVPPLMAKAIAEQLLKYLNSMPKKKERQYYTIPDEYWLPLHFVRPRFKNNIENVLLEMATACCRIKKDTCDNFADRLNAIIKTFPGNIDKTFKTINNWRTETPALFNFYDEDKKRNITRCTKLAEFLYNNQDLVQFFKHFLFSFQFPGGHIKSNEVIRLIVNGVKFKPAQYVLQVIIEGNKIISKNTPDKFMSLSAEEATYCIFDDKRVTSGIKTPKEVAQTVLLNRRNHIKYYNKSDYHIFDKNGKPLSKGDVTRYAGDVLDYMVIASLLEENHNYYYLNGKEHNAIDVFVKDKTFFHGYDRFYNKKKIENAEISAIEPDWSKYVEDEVDAARFKTDISSIIGEDDNIKVVFDSQITELLANDDTTTKDIGNVGESLVLGHEKMSLKLANLQDLAKLVRIVDIGGAHPGFDIESYEIEDEHDLKRIEVKTTISKRKIEMFNFHMTAHECKVAKNDRHYYVYRLMLSQNDKTLYILKDPYGLMYARKIDVTIGDGMDVVFDVNNH